MDKEIAKVLKKMGKKKLLYLAEYIQEETDKGNKITFGTFMDALDAYNGGARATRRR